MSCAGVLARGDAGCGVAWCCHFIGLWKQATSRSKIGTRERAPEDHPAGRTGPDNDELASAWRLLIPLPELAALHAGRGVDAPDRIGHALGATREIARAQRLSASLGGVAPVPPSGRSLKKFPVVHGEFSTSRDYQNYALRPSGPHA